MKWNQFRNWLASVLTAADNGGLKSSRRMAIRVRRDGKTETVPVEDRSTFRTAVLVFFAAVAFLAVIFSLRSTGPRVSQTSSSVAAAIA